MDKNIRQLFEDVCNKVYDSIKDKEFKRLGIKDEKDITYEIFQKNAGAYRVSYDKKTQICSLSSAEVVTDEDGKDCFEEWKSAVTWLLEEGVANSRDVEDIANDFLKAILGSKQKKLAKNTKKRKKSDDSNVDPIFLFNRLVNVFPELKEEIVFERNNYDDFRVVTFTREKVVPKVDKILVRGEKARIKKLCTILSNMYVAGDLDTRAIVTTVILNSITDEQQKALVNELISNELKDAWKCSQKFIGKNIKPEKVKKKKSFMSDTLR